MRDIDLGTLIGTMAAVALGLNQHLHRAEEAIAAERDPQRLAYLQGMHDGLSAFKKAWENGFREEVKV